MKNLRRFLANSAHPVLATKKVMAISRHLFLLAALSTSLLAQEKPLPRQLRFLPVGDMPPFRQEIRDGVSYELDAEPGSIPPRQLEINLGEEKSITTSLTLGSFSESFLVPSGAMTLTIQKKEGEALSKWHEVALPETGNLAVLLWRDPKVKTWAAARSVVLSDGIDTFPAGSVRLINLLPTQVKFSFADKSIELKASSTKTEVLSAATTPVQISAQDASGAWHVVYQSAITQNTGERGNIILYRADGESPRTPIKVLNLRERAPTIPVKKPTP